MPLTNQGRVRDSLMAKKNKKAAPPVEVDEDEDLELEELEEDVPEEKPTKGKAKSGGDEVAFGASDLAKLANEKFDKSYDAKTIRTLLRKLARSGKLNREIAPENRTRYSWTGPDDPEVKMILKEIKGGAIETARNEALGALKEKKAAERAAKAEAAEKSGKGKKAAKKAAPPVDDDDDVEDLDDDDDE